MVEKNNEENIPVLDVNILEKINRDIQEAIINNDLKLLNKHTRVIEGNVKKLIRQNKQDKLRDLIALFLNKLISNNPIVNPSVYERLNEVLSNELIDIEYELAVLKELRDYLRSCYTTKNYDELANVFSLLIIILYLHNNRRKQSSNEVEVYKCGISGINCIPVPVDNSNVEQCKEAIDVGLQRIRRK